MEQVLTQLEVKILFDDYTSYDDDDATEVDTMVAFVYGEDSDDDKYLIFSFIRNMCVLQCSNVKRSSLFVSLYVLAFDILKNM